MNPKSLNCYLLVDVVVGEGHQDWRSDKVLDVDCYEFLLYRLLRNALEAGNLYVKDRVEFRRFEDDLINEERWQKKKDVLKEIGSQILVASTRKPHPRKIEILSWLRETGLEYGGWLVIDDSADCLARL